MKTIILMTAMFLTVATASAQTYGIYSLTDLGVLPGKKDSTPAAINNQGQVAGTSSAGASSESAFRYDSSSSKEALEDIGKVPVGSVTRAFGINSSGEVVGDSTFGANVVLGSHAAIFRKGSAADLGTLREIGNYSRANGINASGQVVGFCSAKPDDSSSRAFIWSASTGMVDLGTLGGAYAQAFAINDAGFVTGSSQIADGQLGATHAFIYQPFSPRGGPGKMMRDLGTLGGSSSYGMAINANNHVVGYFTLNNSENGVHAFLHNGTKMQDLGSLGGSVEVSDQSVALGINVADEVVGYTYLPATPTPYDSSPSGPLPPRQVAFIYSQGVMTNLNALIGAAAKRYALYSATAISDKGQITADAFDYKNNAFHAVLLTPTRN